MFILDQVDLIFDLAVQIIVTMQYWLVVQDFRWKVRPQVLVDKGNEPYLLPTAVG